MKSISAVFAVSLVLAAGTAFAADPPKPTSKPTTTQSMDHSKMDMSGNKPADHRKMADDMFVKLDTNSDGSLSKSELPAKHPLAMHFGMLDTNKDGSLSKAEFANRQGM